MSEHRDWRGFSALLDEALALGPEQRASWLAEVAQRAPDHAARLRTLLASAPELEASGFLEDASLGRGPPSLVGERIGPWRIESELGRGGMSSVWRARRDDGRMEVEAAIKFVSFAMLGHEGERRFRREGLLLGRLDHPNIARLLDAGLYAPTRQPYLVLEYVDGVPIDAYCDAARLGATQRVALFLDVLSAVAHAHDHLVVHRDLKPSNVLVTSAGVVKLLDFGIAKLLEGDDDITRTGLSAVTPQYAAPEQLTGGAITTRTDVYALGLLLYRLLSGRDVVPVDSSHAEWRSAIVESEPPPPSGAKPGIDGVRQLLAGDLDNIVMKALRKVPEHRYATAAAFADDLARHLRHEPVMARPQTLAYRASRFVRRNRASLAAAALVTIALFATTAFAVAQMLEARRQRDAARLESERAQAQAAFADQLLMQTAEVGERLTPELLLARSVEFVEKRFAGEPELTVGLLIHLSGRYMNRGDTAKELETLLKAWRLAVEAGDPLLLARVECNSVETELAVGRRAQARARLERGLAALARVPAPTVQQRCECLLAEAVLRRAEADALGAIEAAAQAAKLLEDANGTSGLVYQSVTSLLTTLHRSRLELARALEWNERDLAALERAGFGRSENAVSALHQRAQVLAASGQWVAALELAREVIARSQAHDPSGNAHPFFLWIFASGQFEVGEWQEAGAVFARAELRARQSGNDTALIGVLTGIAKLAIAQGEHESARMHIAEARALGEQDPTRNAAALTALRVASAELALARGDMAAAARELAAARAQIAQADRRHPSAAPGLRLASALALAQGDPAAAERFAREALRFSEEVALDPSQSADVGEAWLALARARASAGAIAEAREAAARAARALRPGRGQAHPSTREAEARALAPRGGAAVSAPPSPESGGVRSRSAAERPAAA